MPPHGSQTEWAGVPDSDEVASESFLRRLAEEMGGEIAAPSNHDPAPAVVVIDREGFDCRVGDRPAKRVRATAPHQTRPTDERRPSPAVAAQDPAGASMANASPPVFDTARRDPPTRPPSFRHACIDGCQYAWSIAYGLQAQGASEPEERKKKRGRGKETTRDKHQPRNPKDPAERRRIDQAGRPNDPLEEGHPLQVQGCPQIGSLHPGHQVRSLLRHSNLHCQTHS